MPLTSKRFDPFETGQIQGKPVAVPADGQAGRAAVEWRWHARWILGIGLAFLLVQAFVPLIEFTQRGDDAFYYFKVALNYSRLGFWTFDGIHPTNGVQPLWAILLSGLAQLCAWVGITDAYVMARVFVGFTAVVQFAAAVALYAFLARIVSVGTGLIAAGAFMFPLGMAWGRTWGMESPLYALMLVAVVAFYIFRFRPNPGMKTAALMGALLGLLALSRLNGGFLIPCLFLYHLFSGDRAGFGKRLQHLTVAGVVATAVLLPSFIINYLSTGHVLPISGSVKGVLTELALRAENVQSRFSIDFLKLIYWRWYAAVPRYFSDRFLEGTWPTGLRAFFPNGMPFLMAAGAAAVLAFAPGLTGTMREWMRVLRERFARLKPLWFFVVFAVMDSIISVWLYPTHGYSIVRWWMVPNELMLVTLSATLLAASISYASRRIEPLRRGRYAVAIVSVMIGLYGWQVATYFWNGKLDYRPWSLSWNDEMYRATQWMNENVPSGERIGSWNAGVVGYYSDHAVINLDGLINNFELLPYIRERRLADYITEKQIRYLSDMERYVERSGVGEQLKLTEVYSNYSEFLKHPYKVYRVDR